MTNYMVTVESDEIYFVALTEDQDRLLKWLSKSGLLIDDMDWKLMDKIQYETI